MTKEQITALARNHGTSYTNRHLLNEPAFAFGNEAWAAFCEALVAAQPPAVEARGVIEQCRAALAEELAGWDLDPPLHHVKQVHDRCVEWLIQATIAQPARPHSEAVAVVMEEIPDTDGSWGFAKIRWLHNPVPAGEELRWEINKLAHAPCDMEQPAPVSQAKLLRGILEAWEKWAFSTGLDERNHDLCEALKEIRDSTDAVEAALQQVSAAVQVYLPPDGITKDEFINRVIACVDPWPVLAIAQPVRQTPTPTPSAWRGEHTSFDGAYTVYDYARKKPADADNCVPMFTIGQLNQYGQACFDEGVSSVHSLGESLMQPVQPPPDGSTYELVAATNGSYGGRPCIRLLNGAMVFPENTALYMREAAHGIK